MNMTYLRKRVRGMGFSFHSSKGRFVVKSPAEFDKVKGHYVFPCPTVATFNNLCEVNTWINNKSTKPVEILKS